MSNEVDVGIATVKKSMIPYFVIAVFIAILGSGGSGMYFGYEIAEGRFSTEKLEIASAYNTALVEKEARRKEAEAHSQEVEGVFLTALNAIKGDNQANLTQVIAETKKAIYDTCKVPDTGVDLLNGHIDAVNDSLLGKVKK